MNAPVTLSSRQRPRRCPSVVIMRETSTAAIERRSLREEDALVVDISRHRVARNGVVVQCTKLQAAFILVLASRPGAVVPVSEVMDLLYGDRADGGPESNIHVKLKWECTLPLAALGYRIETAWGFGLWLRCVLAPIPVTYGDLVADLATASELSHGQA